MKNSRLTSNFKAMKTILLFAFLSCTTLVFSQKVVKEQLHMKNVECQFDTSAVLHLNSTAIVENDEKKNIVFQTDGKNKILMIKVFSTKCDCSDCYESNEIAIKIDSLKLNEVHYFKASEVIWVYKNSWVEPKYITTYLGNITQKNATDYELKISELLGATVIRSINLKVKAE